MEQIELENIKKKHEKLINIATNYMKKVNDEEHDVNHMNDVVCYTEKILTALDENYDPDVCIISAYWHDVGRIKISQGHEELSAKMLKNEMEKQNYPKEMIDKCYRAIVFHKWNMKPETIEGLIVKDADKIAWVGQGRWKSCIENNKDLDSIMELLPKLRNEILYFDCSKKIYDEEVIKIMKYMYELLTKYN